MNPWLSKSLTALGLSLVLSTSVSAANSCEPCPTACESRCGGFDVGVDFLYWKPCVDDLDYAAISSGTGTSADPFVFQERGICPKWEPGFRAYVGKSDVLCGWDLSASFTWMKSDDSAALSEDALSIYPTLAHAALLGDGIAPNANGITGNLFDQAGASWSSKYYAWDLLLAYPLECCGPCFTFSPFFGVSGIYLTQDLSSTLTNTINTATTATALLQTDWDSSLWGVGLKFGSDMNYQFNDCFSLFAAGSVEVLAARVSSGSNNQTVTLVDGTVVAANFNDDDCCLIVPGYHLSAGVRYASDWCGNEFGIRIGYEFLEYHNIPNQRTFMGDQFATQAALSTSSSTRTFGFHGLMVGADVSF